MQRRVLCLLAAAALALPAAMAQREREPPNCEKCATTSDCTYASSTSKNANVLHAYCGKQSDTFYCCPTFVDGRSAQCDVNNIRGCQFRSSGSGSTGGGSDNDGGASSYISYILPVIFIFAIVGIVALVVRRRQQQRMQMIQMAQMQGGQPMFGGPYDVPIAEAVPVCGHGQNPSYGPSGYGQQQGGMGTESAAALGFGGGLLEGYALGSMMDGRDGGMYGGGYGGGGGGGGGFAAHDGYGGGYGGGGDGGGG
mmetsp:Transcript_33612/g.78453  ORF Transcript_33612/g.78453 Transcript_33612/m.78453 type:complete len:253 (-) Transcript_33612:354-1112(-)